MTDMDQTKCICHLFVELPPIFESNLLRREECKNRDRWQRRVILLFLAFAYIIPTPAQKCEEEPAND